MFALVGVCDAQKRSFIEGAAHELQTDRQACTGKSAGDGNCGESGEIGWPGMSDNRGTHTNLLSANLYGFCADERGGNGNRGSHDGVHILKGRVKFGVQLLAHVKPRKITVGQHFSPGLDSLAHFFAIFGSAGREISGRLVDVEGFRKRNVGRRVERFFQVRKGNLTDDRAALFHVAHGCFGRAAHFWVQPLPIMFARAAKAKFAERFSLQRTAEIFHRLRRGSWVEWIAPGDHAEQDGRIRDAASEGGDMIERWRERHGAKDADASEGWLQADGPAKSGWHTDRAAGVGTDRSRAQARGNRDGGARAGSTG